MSGVVLLETRAQALIEHETRKRGRTETGGALFGFADGDDFVVAGAYGPGPRAKHRRTAFEPHAATTGALMDAVREYSKARYRYLGSWHSHPGGVPRPSGPDISTTERVANEQEVQLPCPLVLIQASRPQPASIAIGDLRAWRWRPELTWLMPIEIESIDLDGRLCPQVEVPAGWGRGMHVLSPDAPDLPQTLTDS